MTRLLQQFQLKHDFDAQRIEKLSILIQRALINVRYPLKNFSESCLFFETTENFVNSQVLSQHTQTEFADDFKFKFI